MYLNLFPAAYCTRCNIVAMSPCPLKAISAGAESAHISGVSHLEMLILTEISLNSQKE